MELKIPRPLKVEHEELHEDLVRATKVEGAIGEAARNVAELLHPHFTKEEEYALPPLGLLSALAEGKATPDIRKVLTMTDRLKADLPQMLAEHQAVVGALQKLIAEARRENKPDVVDFAEKLMLHAQTEEEVLYPTALLIGQYLKVQMGDSTEKRRTVS